MVNFNSYVTNYQRVVVGSVPVIIVPRRWRQSWSSTDKLWKKDGGPPLEITAISPRVVFLIPKAMSDDPAWFLHTKSELENGVLMGYMMVIQWDFMGYMMVYLAW